MWRPRRASQHDPALGYAVERDGGRCGLPSRHLAIGLGRRPARAGKPRHSPATSRHPARPRLSACNWRGQEEALKDPGARRLPEKVDHVYHSIFDEPMLREGLQRKLLRSPLLLVVTGLLGLLRKLPARTGRLRARLEATRERKLASLLDRLALSDVYWWMLVRRAQFWRAILSQFIDAHTSTSRHRRGAATSSAPCSSSARRRRRSSSTARTARTAPDW